MIKSCVKIFEKVGIVSYSTQRLEKVQICVRRPNISYELTRKHQPRILDECKDFPKLKEEVKIYV